MWFVILVAFLWRQLFHTIILIVMFILPETAQPVGVVVILWSKCNFQKLLVLLVFQQLVCSVLDGDVSVLMLLLVHFGIFRENWGVVFLAVMVVLLNVFHPDVLVLVVVVKTSLSALLLERFVPRLLLVTQLAVSSGC